MLKCKFFILFAVFLNIINTIYTQQLIPEFKFDEKVKKQSVNKICSLLNDNYVFPETAQKMNDYILSQLNSGAYDTINDPLIFSDVLTADLQSVSKDKHIRVRFSPLDSKRLIEQEKNGSDTEDEIHWNELLKKENYGFRKAEILNGNIGYVDFRNFASPKYSAETIKSVMGFLANTDALIFDLRQNGGGDPECVQLICSYLFKNEPVHLNDLYFRPTNKTQEFWTLSNIEGKRMPEIPVYILTSKFTFSGAEEFAYNLKNLKRAVIIGETTGGGAHPGDLMAINDGFTIFVPKGRAINPITKTNWEGTGVIPDVEVKQELALEKAQVLALETLSANTNDDNQKKQYSWIIESVNANLNALEIDENTLKSYAGEYNDRTISYENGKLFYQRKDRPKFQMIPMTNDTFIFKDFENFRVKFIKDVLGNVTELNGLYADGHIVRIKRTN
ncbi:MAG: hypothetical protein IT280_10800 [Ignavibacteria bacterium]|nr:hypothetical protein [Ignavibacteria bacterium]